MRKLMFLFAIIGAVSCHDSYNLPPIKGPGLTIPGSGKATAVAPSDLEVVFASPKGKAPSRHIQIVVTFNKPVVALAEVEKRAQIAPIHIDPKVAGTQRWLSSRTLAFTPKEPLRGSRSYTLSVKAGLVAQDGSALKAEKTWSFETPRLAVTRHYVPYDARRWAKPNQTVKLYFNQSVDPQAIAPLLSFIAVERKGGQRTTIGATTQRGAWSTYRRSQLDPRVVDVTPANALPLDAKITLQLAKGAVGGDGPLAMERGYRAGFATYGPFSATSISCTKECSPQSTIRIHFSTPARAKDIRAAVRVNGKALIVGRSKYPTSYTYLDVPYKARTSYRVTIAGGLRDRFGQALTGERNFEFRTSDHSPYARLPIGAGVLEAKGPKRLPLFFRNAVAASVHTKRLTAVELSSILADGSHKNDEAYYAKLKGAKAKKLAVAGHPNQRVIQRVDLGRAVGKGGKGLLAIELSAKLRERKKDKQGQPRYSETIDRALVRVTDLGVMAKYSPFGTLLWVTSLSTGKPVASAKVSIWRPGDQDARWRGETDAQGLAFGPGANTLQKNPKESRDYVFVAEKGDDLSYTRSATQSGIRGWDFGIDETWEDGKSGVIGMIFSDRGIYRPGEKVQLKGILRRSDKSGLTLPSGQITLQVLDGRGEKLAKHTTELTRFGTFHIEQVLPAGAALGRYSVLATLGDATVHGSFRVEEFRPAEFAVGIKSDHPQYVRGDTLRWDLDGKYLFGAPMRGTSYRTYMTWSSSSFQPPKHEGYVFHDEVNWWGTYISTSGFVARSSSKLDTKGRAQGSLTLKPPTMHGPRNLTLEATVTDISRQSISNRTQLLLHPGEFYLGAKPKETFISAGGQVDALIVAVDPRGKRVIGQRIAGTLYQRSWHSVRKRGMRGASYFVSRPKETAVGTCAVQSAQKPVRCAIKAAKAGYYVLRLRGQDRRGNPLQTSFGIYVTGPDYVPWRRDAQPKVELVPDRKRYKVGQVARIMIKAPFTPARALLTVERNGIYLRKALTLKKTATWVEVPITAELVPNAFASVMLVRGRLPAPKGKKKGSSSDEDPGKPMFKVGYVKLPISQADRRLRVGVTPQKKTYRPGSEVVVDLSAKDHRGQGVKAELTVIVADEGVLSLIGYRTPNPMNIFYAERGLSVRTADNRIVLLSRRLFGEKGKNPGGGGGGSGRSARGGMRSRFVSTPYFNPTVLTDDGGKAQVRFKLPDNLTTFRIMAVAVGERSLFGSGQSKVTVNKPLLLLPTLPRLVRVGDTVQAGVVVHNHAKKSGKVTVKATVEGLELVGAASQDLDLADGAAGEARFTYRATHAGTAVFRYVARFDDFEDALELKRPVRLPLVAETVATFGVTESSVAEGLLPSGNIRKDYGGLEVAMSSSALVGLRAGFDYLLSYPYECTEQSVSRLVPLALFKQLTTAYGLKKPAQIDALVAKLITRVERTQRWNGGFSYWTSSSYVHPWLSIYATWGLAKVKKAGFRVSDQVLAKAKRFLKRQLKQGVAKEREQSAYDRSLKAFAAHVLTELGEKPVAELNKLYEHRQELPIFARALMVSAMARAGSDGKAVRTALEEMLNAVHQTGKVAKVEENLGGLYAPLFHSNNRSTAMVLDTLLRVQPDHPLVEKLVAYMVAQRKDGRWRNTQETVYALVALHSYYERHESEVPDFEAKVVLGRKKLVEETFKGRTLKVRRAKVPMQKLFGERGILGFIKEGKGRLHYTAKLRYARAELPKSGWDEGFFVTRSYEAIPEGAGSFAALRGKQGKAQTGKGAGGVQKGSNVKVAAGDLVRVKLRIVVPQQMHYVVVDDPLPAGLEAVNFNLMTASRASGRFASGGGYKSRYGRSGWWTTPFTHRETRDDRVQLFADSLAPGVYTYVYLARATTIGSFVAPPTFVEQMYEPETFGRTGTVAFEVTAP